MTSTILSIAQDIDARYPREMIYQFKDEHVFLSNFYPCKVMLDFETFRKG